MLRALAAVHVSSENAVFYENCVLRGRALVVDKNGQGSRGAVRQGVSEVDHGYKLACDLLVHAVRRDRTAEH